MQSKILKGALTAAVTQDEYSTVFNKNESFEGCCTWKKKHEVFVISFVSCSRIWVSLKSLLPAKGLQIKR